MSVPRFWYSVVSVLPDPETQERVNSALIIGTDRWARLEYLQDLPKLACLITPEELPIFRNVLAGVQRRLDAPSELETLGAQLGPHFHVTPPRELYQSPEGRILRLLQNRFLRPHAAPRPKRVRHSAQREATSRLDRVLIQGLPATAVIEKTATVEHLYPELDRTRVFTASVPRLNRAIRIGDVDVLIGGVVVEQKDPLTAARDATARISQAFWQYRHARAAIQASTGRTVRTIGVVLNGTSANRPEVRSAKEYVRHIWEDDADLLFAPERREDEVELVNKIEELTPLS